jgi:hypothetical protein
MLRFVPHRKWSKLVVLCLAGFLGGLCLVRLLPFRHNGQIEHEVPDREDIFIVNANNGDLSYHELWHGFGRSIENARKAELLIVGNSRVQFALREDVVVAPLREQGVNAFMLAVGHSEPGRFFLHLIRRHDLRPKVLLVNVDERFFKRFPGPAAKHVMNSTRWAGSKEFYGDRLSWWLEGRIHRVVPRWLPYVGDSLVIYRSETTGSWLQLEEPERPIPFKPNEGAFSADIPTREDSFAAEFKKEMDARGTALVLMTIPHPEVNMARTRRFGEHWNVPVIDPEVGDLATSDGSHMIRSSAERYGRAVVEELMQVRTVQELRGR